MGRVLIARRPPPPSTLAVSGSEGFALAESALASAPGSATYPNMPATVSVIAKATMDVAPAAVGDFPMHSVSGYPTGKFAANGNLALVTDPTAPLGRTTVTRARFPATTSLGGFGKWNYALWSAVTNTNYYSTFYLSQVWKIVGNGSTYENESAGTKLGFIASGNTGQDAQNFMWLHNSQGTQNALTAWRLQFKQQDDLVSGQINRDQNNGYAGQLLTTLGDWFHMEVICTTNTLGSVTAGLGGFIGDGTLNVHIRKWNGSAWGADMHIMTYSNMCYRRTGADKLFKFYNNNCTWGGQTGAKTQTDDFYYSELLVACAA